MAPERPLALDDDAGAIDGAQERAARTETAGEGPARTGLLIDWGGVLTSSLFASFQSYCLQVQIDPQTLLGRFRTDPAARDLLIALEKGDLQEAAFELGFADLLGIDPEGLVDGLFAGVEPDTA